MAPETVLEEQRQAEDLDSRRILLVGAGTLGLVGLTLSLVLLFMHLVGIEGPKVSQPSAFAPPRLQSDDAGDLRDYQADQRSKLQGYAWADRERGLVRIPIERAMAMTAARGAEAYAPLDPPQQPDPRR